MEYSIFHLVGPTRELIFNSLFVLYKYWGNTFLGKLRSQLVSADTQPLCFTGKYESRPLEKKKRDHSTSSCPCIT